MGDIVKSLYEVLSFLDCSNAIIKISDQKIENLCTHTDAIKPGSIYLALEGTYQHGNQFAEIALQKGAVVVLTDQEESEHVNNDKVVTCTTLKTRLIKLLNWFYDNPSDELKLIAVTGTNGKTSVCSFIAQVYASVSQVGFMSTIGTGVWPNLQASSHTTADIGSTYHTIAAFQSQQLNTVVCEASSHGLHQGRLAGLAIDAAVFTNLSRDHLDYHGDMEQYFAAKKILFQWPTLQVAIINISDPYGQRLSQELAQERPELRQLTYSSQSSDLADVSLLSSTQLGTGSTLSLKIQDQQCVFSFPILGLFNIENALAAITLLHADDWNLGDIQLAIQSIQPVPGRMQVIENPGCPRVLIDFAHTPDAVTKVLTAVHAVCSGELWVVFGCGGERDQGKRPIMAQNVEHWADHVIVTEDNSRNEPLSCIIEDILSGFNQKDCAIVQQHRNEAITFALEHAKPDDWVVLLGKGHENYLDKAGQKIPFSEQAIVEQYWQGE